MKRGPLSPTVTCPNCGDVYPRPKGVRRRWFWCQSCCDKLLAARCAKCWINATCSHTFPEHPCAKA